MDKVQTEEMNTAEKTKKMAEDIKEYYGVEGAAGATAGALVGAPMGISIATSGIGAQVGAIVNADKQKAKLSQDEGYIIDVDRDYSLKEVGIMGAINGIAASGAVLADAYDEKALSAAGNAYEAIASGLSDASNHAVDAATQTGAAAINYGAEIAANGDEAAIGTIAGIGAVSATLAGIGIGLDRAAGLLESDSDETQFDENDYGTETVLEEEY